MVLKQAGGIDGSKLHRPRNTAIDIDGSGQLVADDEAPSGKDQLVDRKGVNSYFGGAYTFQ